MTMSPITLTRILDLQAAEGGEDARLLVGLLTGAYERLASSYG